MNNEKRIGISLDTYLTLQSEVQEILNRLESQKKLSMRSMTRDDILEEIYKATSAETLKEHFALGVIANKEMERKEAMNSFEIPVRAD